jgi:hemolysin III
MYHGERLNSFTHLIGLVCGIAATSVLITLACIKGDVSKIVGMSVYGGMLILLFAASTVYHSTQGPKKKIFQQLDHCSIYLYIAGIYTPFMLVMGDALSYGILFGVWFLALVGILQELIIGPRTRKYSLLIYFLMGGVTILDTQTLMQKLSVDGFRWIIAGGVTYTLGVLVYVNDHRIKHGHGIWHLMVLAGSACHFIALGGYVL